MTTIPTPSPTATSPDRNRLERDGARPRAVHEASRALRGILRANAAFCLVCGIVGLLAADPLAERIGADVAWLVRLVGLGLVAYSPVLFVVAAGSPRRLAVLVPFVSAADFAWVAGTVALLAAGVLAASGAWILGLAALVVLCFGLEQVVARHRLVRILDPSTV